MGPGKKFRPGIAEVMGSNPVTGLNFFQVLFSIISSVVFLAARISQKRSTRKIGFERVQDAMACNIWARMPSKLLSVEYSHGAHLGKNNSITTHSPSPEKERNKPKFRGKISFFFPTFLRKTELRSVWAQRAKVKKMTLFSLFYVVEQSWVQIQVKLKK